MPCHVAKLFFSSFFSFFCSPQNCLALALFCWSIVTDFLHFLSSSILTPCLAKKTQKTNKMLQNERQINTPWIKYCGHSEMIWFNVKIHSTMSICRWYTNKSGEITTRKECSNCHYILFLALLLVVRHTQNFISEKMGVYYPYQTSVLIILLRSIRHITYMVLAIQMQHTLKN